MTELEQRLEISRNILNSYISSGNITLNSTDENIDNYIKLSVKLADRLINELTIINPDEDTISINEKFDFYSLGRLEVDRIMDITYSNSIVLDLKKELLIPIMSIKKENQIDYYLYLSNLFLNVLLNRLSSYKNIEKAEDRALDAREKIGEIIKVLREN